MAYSQKSMQDRALREATMTGGDPHASPVIDNSVVLEDLFYSALRQSVILGSQNEPEAGSLKRDYTITVTNGVGPLPDTVVDECLDMSSVYGADEDIADLSSFQPRYGDYLRPPSQDLLNYYAVQGSSFLFREAGGNAGEYDGAIHLVTIGTPDIPGTITSAITISTETAERTIQILAGMLRGAAVAA